MKHNKIRLIYLQCESGLIKAGARHKPEDLVQYAIDKCTDPETIKEYDISEDEQAHKDLAEYKNTCDYMPGAHGAYWLIRAYVLEYYTANPDGEFIAGSDYDY